MEFSTYTSKLLIFFCIGSIGIVLAFYNDKYLKSIKLNYVITLILLFCSFLPWYLTYCMKNHTSILQEAAIYLSTTNLEKWESNDKFTIINTDNQRTLKIEDEIYIIEIYSNHTIHLIGEKNKTVMKARNGELIK